MDASSYDPVSNIWWSDPVTGSQRACMLGKHQFLDVLLDAGADPEGCVIQAVWGTKGERKAKLCLEREIEKL